MDDQRLTPRECEVRDLMQFRLTNKEMAVRLGISERTVKFHMTNLMKKFGVSSRQDLACRICDTKTEEPEEQKPNPIE